MPLLQLSSAQPESPKSRALHPSARIQPPADDVAQLVAPPAALGRHSLARQKSPSHDAALRPMPASLSAASPSCRNKLSSAPRDAPPSGRGPISRRPESPVADCKQPGANRGSAVKRPASRGKRKADAAAVAFAKDLGTKPNKTARGTVPDEVPMSPKRGPGRPKKVAPPGHSPFAASPRAAGAVPDQQGLRAKRPRIQGDQEASCRPSRPIAASDANVRDAPASPRKQTLRASSAAATAASDIPVAGTIQVAQQLRMGRAGGAARSSHRNGQGGSPGKQCPESPLGSPSEGTHRSVAEGAHRTGSLGATANCGSGTAGLRGLAGSSSPSSPSKGTHHKAAANARWERYREAKRLAGSPVPSPKPRKQASSAAPSQHDCSFPPVVPSAGQREQLAANAQMVKTRVQDSQVNPSLSEHDSHRLPTIKKGRDMADLLSSGPEDGEILPEAEGDPQPDSLHPRELHNAHANDAGMVTKGNEEEEQQNGGRAAGGGPTEGISPVKDQGHPQAAHNAAAGGDQHQPLGQSQKPAEAVMQQPLNGSPSAVSSGLPPQAAVAGSKGLDGKKRSRELAQLLDHDAPMTGAPAMVPLSGEGASRGAARRGLRGTRSGQ